MDYDTNSLDELMQNPAGFTEDEYIELIVDKAKNNSCFISSVYAKSRLNTDQSQIANTLDYINEVAEADKSDSKKMHLIGTNMGTYVLPKEIQTHDDFIYHKVPCSIAEIIEKKFKLVEEVLYEEKEKTCQYVIDNYGKGIMAWATKNIIEPAIGIVHSIMTFGEILYFKDYEEIKEEILEEIDYSYPEQLREIKEDVIDGIMLQYLNDFCEASRNYKNHVSGKLAIAKFYANKMDTDKLKKNLGYGLAR